MNAKIVIGLMFGDEGKGIMTDELCSQINDTIVVRFSGGQNAGHTVIINDKKHVHSNYGSGTLRGRPSYFTEHCSVYLNTLNDEKNKLEKMGITPKLYVHPLAKLTTPYDVAYNQMREHQLRHGSCGVGISSTMQRHDAGYKLYAMDLFNEDMLKKKLVNIGNYYSDKVKDYSNEEKYIFTGYLLTSLRRFSYLLNKNLFDIVDYSELDKYTQVVFEGSQGILLDMDHGIFPNVTYANTTCKNAMDVLNKIGYTGYIDIYYMTRCYQTRHGNGWMSNNDDITLINNEEEINIENEWQGKMRVGELDYNLINQSLRIDDLYHINKSKIHKHLTVTCLDQRPHFKVDYSKIEGIHKIIERRSAKNN